MGFLDKYQQIIEQSDTLKETGFVDKVVGLLIESSGPVSQLYELCEIQIPDYRTREMRTVEAEVVGFRNKKVILMALGDTFGIAPGCEVVASGGPIHVPVGEHLLGRIIGGDGKPVDEMGPIVSSELYSIFNAPPSPIERPRITEALTLGIRSIDGLMTVGRGQRMGIFSGSGVGKSTMLGMVARNTNADVNVIALTGERGREVREFIERDLGEEGFARSVMVVATGDESPLLRLRAAYVAVTIAEYFRDKGNDVMLMVDSVTRFARAQREIGLAIGEIPAQRGYPPSIYTMLPNLLERIGTSKEGSITGILTVLVEADDMNEPISDTVRGILDGHVALSRDLAHMGHYPAVDVLTSISRLMVDITDEEHQQAGRNMREVLALYKKHEMLITIGAYEKGANPALDYAIAKLDSINEYLQQGIFEKSSFDEARTGLLRLFEDKRISKSADNYSNVEVGAGGVSIDYGAMPFPFEAG